MTQFVFSALVLEEYTIASCAHCRVMPVLLGPTIVPIERTARSILCPSYSEVFAQSRVEVLGDDVKNGRDVLGIETRRLPRYPEDAQDGHHIVTGQVGHLRRRPSRNRDSAQVALVRPATRDKSLRRASLALLGVPWRCLECGVLAPGGDRHDATQRRARLGDSPES